MRPKVVPIASPFIELPVFLDAAKQAIGYQPVKNAADAKGVDYVRFLAGLSAFQDAEARSRPMDLIRKSPSLKSHLSFTFLIAGTKRLIMQSMARSGLTHTFTEQLDETMLAVVSGTLHQWHQATIDCTALDADFNLRYAYDQVFNHFKVMGLTEVWDDTNRTPLPDRTFRITHK